jgi:hypothetical protein
MPRENFFRPTRMHADANLTPRGPLIFIGMHLRALFFFQLLTPARSS